MSTCLNFPIGRELDDAPGMQDNIHYSLNPFDYPLAIRFCVTPEANEVRVDAEYQHHPPRSAVAERETHGIMLRYERKTGKVLSAAIRSVDLGASIQPTLVRIASALREAQLVSSMVPNVVAERNPRLISHLVEKFASEVAESYRKSRSRAPSGGN